MAAAAPPLACLPPARRRAGAGACLVLGTAYLCGSIRGAGMGAEGGRQSTGRSGFRVLFCEGLLLGACCGGWQQSLNVSSGGRADLLARNLHIVFRTAFEPLRQIDAYVQRESGGISLSIIVPLYNASYGRRLTAGSCSDEVLTDWSPTPPYTVPSDLLQQVLRWWLVSSH